MGTTHPVFALSEMALSAHPEAVIHIDDHTRFGYEEITIILIMTRKTGQGFLQPAVNEGDIPMGHFGRLRYRHCFMSMTLTALVALDLILPGPCPERSPLVFCPYQNTVFGHREV